MKSYIFYTKEGYTQGPENSDIENCQVVGWANGNTPDEAFENFKSENSYLSNHRFSEILCQQLTFDEVFEFTFS